MQIIVEKLLTQYTRIGSGDIILVLHGWGDSVSGVKEFANGLSNKYEVIAVDLPGFGGSQSPDNAWGLDDYADFVKEFVTKLGLKVSVIVGHSNGGAIAIRCLTRGLQADQLVLIASAGIRGEYKGRNKALRILAKIGKPLAMPLPRSLQKKLRHTLYTSVGSDMLVAEHLQETFKRVVSDDVLNEARAITLPTLIVYGDQDVSTPQRFGVKFNEALINSRLVIIPDGEHMLLTERTSEVVKLVREFLK